MTDQLNTEANTGRSKGPKWLAAVVVAVVLAAAIWFVFLRDTSAEDVNSGAAAAARDGAVAAANADNADVADGVDGVDGVWTVDTSIGTFNDACLSDVCDATFAGFRIDEELASVGAKTVVGRSPGVSGSLEISGTTITTVDIVVDMTQLITDSRGRTSALRGQSIETSDFPEASFVLTEPIDIGSVPADGEPITMSATGDFTIHGVTRSETLELTAELKGDTIIVFGQLGPVLLADYDIGLPSAAVVLSVEDNALIELQVFFRKS